MLRVQTFACVLAGALAAQIGLAEPGSAFECPEPEAQGARGVIPESPQEIGEFSALLGSSDLENRLEMIAHALKRKYPNADKTELTNFMIAAYCPVVAADQDLDDPEKAQRLDRFNEEVWQIYSDLGL
jgi:hypothetical protein